MYDQDVHQRLNEVNACITSPFERVLKMDSTKKVARKLAGHSAGTATWVTNVGNEHGLVIMTVFASSEGFGLVPMVTGIIKRYKDAAVPPPELLYVDRNCCVVTYLKLFFEKWKDMEIRLDIWHFMRKISVGCTTDSHQLYSTFMAHLSTCIFSWGQKDVDRRIRAKRAELEAQLMLMFCVALVRVNWPYKSGLQITPQLLPKNAGFSRVSWFSWSKCLSCK